MSSDTTSPIIKLSVFTVSEWKNAIITKALELNAYEILTNTESPPDPKDRRLVAEYSARRSKLAGYIRSTLDMVQITTVLSGVDILDLPAVFVKLVTTYKPKTSASRVSLLQELTTLRKKEEETFEQYGSRAIEIASRLIALLPKGASYEKEKPTKLDGFVHGDGHTTASPVYKAATFNHLSADRGSTFDAGYSAKDLARDLALSMIPIGLGTSENEKMLRHTLNHIDKMSSKIGRAHV